MDHLSKFQPNRTVNKLGNTVLQNLRKLEKMVATSAHKWGRWRLAGLYYRRAVPVLWKVQKTAYFVNQSATHHWYGAWRPIGCR